MANCGVSGARTQNSSPASGKKMWREALKKRPLHDRGKTEREASRVRGKFFDNTGAKQWCAPSRETGISSLKEKEKEK